jgi:hypothetical protein
MVRQLLIPALLAVLCAPDWATAFDPCVCPPPVYVSPCPPVRGVVVYGPVVNCQPVAGTVAPTQGPTIVPERMEQPKKPQVTADPPKMMPVKAEEPVAPKPAPLPIFKPEEPKPTEPMAVKPVEPMPVKPIEPKPESKQVVPPTERIQTPAVPPAPPATKPDLGKLDFDIPPIGDVPLAKPQPAPSDTPKTPAAKPTETPKTPEKLPEFKFDLPKAEGGMAQPVEANKKTVANSSPLSDKVAEVEVFPRDGSNVVAAKRGVTFVNKSARDILLTVDGRTVTLPSKTVMTADLPAAFKWQIGGEPERSEKVPDGSPGIDVVIRK